MIFNVSLEVFKKTFAIDITIGEPATPDEDEHPAGDVFADTERLPRYTMEPELHAGHRPDYWGVEEDRARRSRVVPVRRQPMGFTRRTP